MRRRLVIAFAATAILGSAIGAPAGATTGDVAARAGRICFDTPPSDVDSVISQNFEAAFDAYDAVAADDFRLARHCRARALTVEGNYGAGIGHPRSETVTFYRDHHGRPGRLIREQTLVGTDVGNGVFDIVLDRAVRMRAERAFWISVQVNMDFGATGDHWAWWAVKVGDGAPSMWKNPGDGFESGCTDWGTVADCLDIPQTGLAFELRTR